MRASYYITSENRKETRMKVTSKGKKSPEEFEKLGYQETTANVFKKEGTGGYVLVDLNNKDVILFVKGPEGIDFVMEQRNVLSEKGLIERS